MAYLINRYNFEPNEIWKKYRFDHRNDYPNFLDLYSIDDLLWDDFCLKNPQYFPDFNINYSDFYGNDKCSVDWLEQFLADKNKGIDVTVFPDRFRVFDSDAKDLKTELFKCPCGLFFMDGDPVDVSEIKEFYNKYPFVTMYLDLMVHKANSDLLVVHIKDLFDVETKQYLSPNVEVRFGSLFRGGRIKVFDVLCLVGNMYTVSISIKDDFKGDLEFDFDDRLLRNMDMESITVFKKVMTDLIEENKLSFVLLAWVIGSGFWK